MKGLSKKAQEKSQLTILMKHVICARAINPINIYYDIKERSSRVTYVPLIFLVFHVLEAVYYLSSFKSKRTTWGIILGSFWLCGY